MRYGLITLAAAAAFGLSLAGAMADGTAPAPTSVDTASTSTGDPNKIVCKSSDAPTGSRIGAHRVCQTQAAWEALGGQNKMDLPHEQPRGSLFSTPGG